MQIAPCEIAMRIRVQATNFTHTGSRNSPVALVPLGHTEALL